MNCRISWANTSQTLHFDSCCHALDVLLITKFTDDTRCSTFENQDNFPLWKLSQFVLFSFTCSQKLPGCSLVAFTSKIYSHHTMPQIQKLLWKFDKDIHVNWRSTWVSFYSVIMNIRASSYMIKESPVASINHIKSTLIISVLKKRLTSLRWYARKLLPC